MSAAQILGLVTGIFFGFCLQRGGALRVENQLNMLLLKDMTVLHALINYCRYGRYYSLFA